MKSPLQRRTALAAALLAPTLAACGFSAQTDQVYQAAVGANDRSGDVEILNALIVSGEDGEGTFAGTLVNSTTDEQTLVGVTGEGITADLGTVTVGSLGHSNLALPTQDGGPQVTLEGTSVTPGRFVRLTFAFSSGQSTEVLVPVQSNESEGSTEYAEVPLPSDKPTAEPTRKPTDGATETAPDSGDSSDSSDSSDSGDTADSE